MSGAGVRGVTSSSFETVDCDDWLAMVMKCKILPPQCAMTLSKIGLLVATLHSHDDLNYIFCTGVC